ncbi:MAG TPA: hypothetical protein VLI90_08485, partial [Tepidisphaeraceae bacterium]|nr:hypothetical protein [Tepidisphaeraceae bacterium]
MSSPQDPTPTESTPPPPEIAPATATTAPTEPGIPPEDSLVIMLPDESSQPKDLGLWAGVLVILTLVAYWPSTDGSFLWNDDRHVSDNRLLAQPGGLSTIWFQRWQDEKAYPLPEYHPVAYTSYWLDYHLFGHDAQTRMPTPFMYRLSNLLLHALTAVLVWLTLRRLKVPGAWVAAAAFALHPLNTEAIAYISQRATVLAGALFFGAIYTYLM